MIATLEWCLAQVWRLSWQTSALVALVLAVQFLAGRRLSARWRYNLWLLVVVRLVLPFSWQSPLSVFNAVNWGTSRANAVIERVVPSSVTTPITARTDAAPRAETPTQEAPQVEWKLAPTPSPEASPILLPPHPPTHAVSTPPRTPFPWRHALALLWAGGALLLAVRIVITSWRMQRRIRGATRIDNPALLTLLEECRQRMGLRQPLAAVETTAIHSPAVFGFLRPQLLLPRGLAQTLSTPELRHVFFHELAHVRRLDLPMNWLLTALQVLHWFNPIIWLGLRCLRADRESACDALAIERNGNCPADEYGHTIIKLLESAVPTASAPGLMGIVESKSQMVRRIRMIAHFRRNPRWSWLAIFLTAVLAIVGLTDAAHRVQAEAAKAAEPEKTLRVTVVDAETGQPLPHVGLYGPYGSFGYETKPSAPILTDARGVAQLPVSRFQNGFLAIHPDYAPAGWERNPKNGQQIVTPEECTLKLERGDAIGGLVRDTAGQPLAGITIEINGQTRYWQEENAPTFSQYPAYVSRYSQELVSDAAGHWNCPHFPLGIRDLEFTFKRPDGGRHSMSFNNAQASPPKALLEARQSQWVTTLPEGVEVSGLARDPVGRPLAGLIVTERDRRQLTPVAVQKTDAQGHFALPHRDPHQILLTLSGDGLATAVRVLTIEPGLPEQNFTMSPALPLHLHIVDEAGAPIAGAAISPVELDLGWVGKSDAEGRVTWPVAPREAQIYSVEEEKHRSRILQLTTAASEITVALRSSGPEGTSVLVKPISENGQPIANFTVLAAYEGNSIGQYGAFEPLGEGQAGVSSTIVPYDKSRHSSFRLKVTAPGLLPYLSEPLDPQDGEPVLTPILHAGALPQRTALTGKVLLPDGQPAAKASVIVTNTEGPRSSVHISTFLGEKMRIETQNAKAARTEADGLFALPAAAPETPILFIHDEGFLFTTVGELSDLPKIRLTPWGKVEGTFSINGQPRAGQRMNLQPLSAQRPYDLWFSISAKTDQEGRFQLSPALVGPCVLEASQPSDGQWPQAYQTLVEVTSGSATHVDMAGRGSAVTGHVRLNAPDVDLDWGKNIGTALLIDSEDDGRFSPGYQDFVRQHDYLETIRKPARRVILHSSYPLVFEPDGSFHAEGVPPGKYRLNVTALHRDPAQRNSSREIGKLDQEVEVAPRDSAGPVALGEFTMAIAADAIPRQPAVQLHAQTLGGQPISLANYAGKQVLLLFWATWAPPSTETLAQWKRLYEAHGTDPHFVMLGVSLDDDPAVAQKYADARQWPWEQAQISGREKAEVTEKLEVDTLPTALLLSADGHLLTRNPTEARLHSVVESFLSPTK